MQQIIEFTTNNLVLSLIWVALVGLLIYSFLSGVISPIKSLSTQETTLLINKEDAVVIDVRDAKAFNTGHILGARQLKADAIQNKQFASLEKFKDKPIILVCAMGTTSRGTAQALHKQGFERVSILQGGMNSWESAGLPVSK